MRRRPDPHDFEGMWLCAFAVLAAAATAYGGLVFAAARYLPRVSG